MMAAAKLTDVRAKTGMFNPGDRILVRTSSTLTKEQIRKLDRSVQKFAGCEVRVLVLNFFSVELWRCTGGRNMLLAGPEIIPQDDVQLGVLNLNCSRVEFEPGDILMLRSRKLTDLQMRILKDRITHWAGNQVEVLIG